MSGGAAAAPLAGVRIVELGGIGPVPHAGMLLADLGADVVRVARPGRGELDLVPAECDPVLRGRRLVVADLTDPAALDRVRALVDRADVLVEGFRPGTTERWGLGPADCGARNPRLVYARMTGWGQDGPDAGVAGHDLNYLSVTGALHAMGSAADPPPVPLNLVGDYGGGSTFLVIGVLAALLERATSGRGQVVDAAMVDGIASLLQPILSVRSIGRWTDGRAQNLLDGAAPFYRTYTCADERFVAVSAIEERFYAALLAGLELDPASLPPRSDPASWPVLIAAFTRVFRTRSRDAWVSVFAGTDACVTPVLTFAEAPRHPQVAARGSLTASAGDPAHLVAGVAPRFSRTVTAPGPSAESTDLGDVLRSWS